MNKKENLKLSKFNKKFQKNLQNRMVSIENKKMMIYNNYGYLFFILY